MSSETKKKCVECTKEFEISKYNNYKSNRKSQSFCSKKCKDISFHRDYDKRPENWFKRLIRTKDRQRLKDVPKICEKGFSEENVQIPHITYDLDYNIIKLLCRCCHNKLHSELKQ